MKQVISDKVELKKGAWSPEEDHKLVAYIKANGGSTSWSQLPLAAGLARSGKSCRLRWVNYLRPDLKRGRLTAQEIESVVRLHKSFGNKWSQIAAQLPGRTDNEIKNFWHLRMKKLNSKTVQQSNKQKKTKGVKLNVADHHGVTPSSFTITTYASKDYSCSSENSGSTSSITEPPYQFHIAESYSPPISNNDEHYSRVSAEGNNIDSSPSDDELSRCGGRQMIQENFFQEPLLGIEEDVYIPAESMNMFFDEEEGSWGSYIGIDDHDETKSQDNIDGLTNFWLNIFMEAKQIRSNKNK